MNPKNKLVKELIDALLEREPEMQYTYWALFINIDENRIPLHLPDDNPEELWRYAHSIVSNFGISSSMVILLVGPEGNVLKRMTTFQRHETANPIKIEGGRYKVVKKVDNTEYIINTFDTVPKAKECFLSILNFVAPKNDRGYVIEDEWGNVVETDEGYTSENSNGKSDGEMDFMDLLADENFTEEPRTPFDDFFVVDYDDSIIPEGSIFDEEDDPFMDDPFIRSGGQGLFTVWLEENEEGEYLHIITTTGFRTLINITNKRGYLVGLLDRDQKNFEYEIIDGDEEEIVVESMEKFGDEPDDIWAIIVVDLKKIKIIAMGRKW